MIVDGQYEKLSQDEIQDALETELQNEFGTDIDLTQSSVFSILVETLAAVLSSNQEASLKEVYEAAFLGTADGIDLDRVVSIIGIRRRSAVHATGLQRFTASGKVGQNYTIQSGTTVQTRGDSPIEFETTDAAILRLIDSFDDGDIAEYSGDTVSGSVIASSDAVNGDNVLQLDATNGAHIYNDSITLKQGSTFHCYLKPESNTVPAVTFAVDPSSANNHYHIAADEVNDEVRLERVEGGSVTSTIDTLTSASLVAGDFHEVVFNWTATDSISVTVKDIDGNELGTLGGTDTTFTSGHPGFKSLDANSTKEFDWYTTSAVSANIRSLIGGTRGNVGANSISRMPSPPSGVDTTTNLYPTGDSTYVNRDQEDFTTGRERETDDELRNRANNTVTSGGDATHDAIVSHLINEVAGVTSVTLYENKTDTDNTGTGGLPPHSFEAVVFGGTDEDVAQGIFDKKAVTSRDYSGVNGTAASATVQADANDQTRTIEWSRPSKIDVDITLDLAIDDSYIGDDNLRDDIVAYIGGKLSNDSDIVGLGVGENVKVDQITDIVIGDDTGVVALDQSVDGSPIETTPSITTVNGMRVIDIGANEVAQTDATDASITINTRNVT